MQYLLIFYATVLYLIVRMLSEKHTNENKGNKLKCKPFFETIYANSSGTIQGQEMQIAAENTHIAN